MFIDETEPQLNIITSLALTWEQKALTVCQHVAHQESLESTLKTLAGHMVSLLKADRCFVMEFDEQGAPQPVQIEALRSEAIRSFKGVTPPWNECPFLRETAEKRLTHTRDAWNDPILDEVWRERFQQMKIRGLLACPIIYKDEILQVLMLHTEEVRPWSEGELLFTQLCTAQAALSISQARLRESKTRYETLYRWEKQSREILQDIREYVDSEEVFSRALDTLASTLQVSRALLLEFSDGTIQPIRHEYLHHEAFGSLKGFTPQQELCPFLSSSSQMSWSVDTLTDERVSDNELWQAFSRDYGIRSILAAPILYKDQLMNVLVFHQTAPRTWSEQERFFLQTVCDQLATVFYQRKFQEALIQTAQLKSDFLSKMSHELRTPLNSIIGYSKMIEKGMVGPLTDKQAEYLQYVGISASHLLDLVNDLLDFSKIEAGKMRLSPEILNLSAIVVEVESMLVELARKKHVALQFDIQEQIDPVTADPQRFKQILINLISNGIKFNHPGGQVTVRLKKTLDCNFLVGEVEDNGIGIAHNKYQELFTRFHQVDNSASRQHEGSGLGLVLTKELVELHGGEISVSSTEGKGTTFTFLLPQPITTETEANES